MVGHPRRARPPARLSGCGHRKWIDDIKVAPNTVVKTGDILKFHWSYCKHRDIAGKVQMKFIDTIQYNLREYQSKRDVGCNDPLAITSLRVPEILPPGDYTLEQIITYEINPLRTVSYKLHSNSFRIIK